MMTRRAKCHQTGLIKWKRIREDSGCCCSGHQKIITVRVLCEPRSLRTEEFR